MNSRLHVVLINPEIPQNTGNIGRTCVGLGAPLHLIGEPGFSLESRYLKRAGLDYWPKLTLLQHSGWDEFIGQLPKGADISLFSSRGKISLWKKRFKSPSYLVFGSESRGFPAALYRRYQETMVKIPIRPEIRSLNLATAVGVAAFEAARQLW